ncbi:MAG: hypothetical protein WD266_13175 [Balneolales bacterium]
MFTLSAGSKDEFDNWVEEIMEAGGTIFFDSTDRKEYYDGNGWPTADSNPTAADVEIEFSRAWKQIPKMVYSTTLERVEWNSRLFREINPEESAKPVPPDIQQNLRFTGSQNFECGVIMLRYEQRAD